jgi:hypothetical protein
MRATHATGARSAATSTSPITRWAGSICLAAAVLLIISQALELVLYLILGEQSAAHPTNIFKRVVALLAQYLLLLALTALYARQARAVGTLGLVGYMIATLGILLVAGDWWYEAFMAPQIAVHAPHVFTLSPTGSIVAGAIATAGSFCLGWTLFGIATLRARLFPVVPAILMILGGLAGILALRPLFLLPLAIAVGWMGYLLNDSSRGDATPV